MANHRDRDDGAPEAGDGQGAPEPEFGSSEWLLQQLSGGRLSGDGTRGEDASDTDAVADADADAEMPTGPRRSNWVEPPASTTPLVVPSFQEPEPEPVPSFDPQFVNPEDTFEFLLPAAETESPAQPTADAGDTPSASVDHSPAEDSAASTGAVPVFEPGAPFSWNLTPGVGADPLVQPETEPDERLDGQETPGTTEPPVAIVPPAPAGPLVAEPPATAPFEPPTFAESLRMPEPPSWDVLLSGAAAEELREAANTPTPNEEPDEPTPSSAWNPFAPEPPAVEPRHEAPVDHVQPEPPVVLVPPVFPPAMDVPPPVSATPTDQPEQYQPEQPQPEQSPREQPQPEPVASDADPGDSHGLASLLGFFDGAPEEEKPSSHSVIGDTTGIVIVPDASLAPHSNEPTPVEPTPVESTSVESTPVEPAPVEPPIASAPPVAPIPAGSFFEPSSPFFEPAAPPAWEPSDTAPTAPASPADTPTTKLDTAEIAALLNARTGDPQPDAVGSSPSAPVPEDSGAVPPLEEAALLMGALPSPATQPLDAESLAAAADASAVADASAAEDAESATDESTIDTSTVDTGTDHTTTDDTHDGTEDDGLAALFARSVPPTAPLSAPSAADAILFPELAAAATEVLPSTVSDSSASASAASGAAVPPTTVFPLPAPGGPTTPGGPTVPGGGGGRGPGGPGSPAGPAGLGGSSNVNRLLFWVAGGLAVVLVLIGLFALGTRLPSLFGGAAPVSSSSASAQASGTPTPTPTPTPTVQPKPAGPQPAGTHPWSTLGGGECIDPYTTPWAETFTVVDCAAPHAAQMVYTNLFSDDPASPYPGADALAQQINLLCTKPGVIDLAAAGAYPDLQLQGTYPATEKQWKDGLRSYYCFANRSSGQPLTSSVAGPGPAA